MEEMFNMKNLVDGFMPKAESFINRQKKNNMNRQVKVTAVSMHGTTIVSGWMTNEMATEYADAMTARGYVVVKQYR